MPFATVRNLDLYYETAGDPAAPPLLIIAGITDYTEKCRWQTGALAADFHVITFDNRDAGLSDLAAAAYTLDDMADDAALLLDALGVGRAHVFGYSMGGMIAQHLVLRHAARVDRLVLGCTTAGGRLLVPPAEPVLTALEQPAQSGDRRQDFLDGMWVSLSDRSVSDRPDVVELLADIAAANPQPADAYRRQLRAVAIHDVADGLGEIRAPVLVQHGLADRLVPPENGRLLADHIPGAKLTLYPDAGHLYFIERAAAVNDEIRAFLQGAP